MKHSNDKKDMKVKRKKLKTGGTTKVESWEKTKPVLLGRNG